MTLLLLLQRNQVQILVLIIKLPKVLQRVCIKPGYFKNLFKVSLQNKDQPNRLIKIMNSVS